MQTMNHAESQFYRIPLLIDQAAVQRMDSAKSDRVFHIISEATESDAQAIADVHMAAFRDNDMLLAQFPTPAIREQLRLCIARKAADDIRDPKIAVLVIHSEGELISFAKWSLPVSPIEKYEEASWIWPEETDFAVLERWTERVLAARGRVMGDRQSYSKLSSLYNDLFENRILHLNHLEIQSGAP